jgi:hypothetical protein
MVGTERHSCIHSAPRPEHTSANSEYLAFEAFLEFAGTILLT